MKDGEVVLCLGRAREDRTDKHTQNSVGWACTTATLVMFCPIVFLQRKERPGDEAQL